VASDKQIAANRRNAQKSSGPRSAAGKKRAGKNAIRHGLSRPMTGPKFAAAVEDLACRIAGDEPAKLAVARQAAEAMLELDRVRRIEVAFVERTACFGRLDAPKIFLSRRDEIAWVMQRFCGVTPNSPPKFAEHEKMPEDEPGRTVEAVRRALPALLRLQRYKTRAAAKRDHAVRVLAFSDYPFGDTS
jgi:hypothetical protein